MPKSPWLYVGSLDKMPIARHTYDSQVGSVYAIEFTNGHTKIGKSRTPFARVATIIEMAGLALGLNLELSKVAVSRPCVNYATQETALHRHFADRHVGGSFHSEVFETTIEEVGPVLAGLPFVATAEGPRPKREPLGFDAVDVCQAAWDRMDCEENFGGDEDAQYVHRRLRGLALLDNLRAQELCLEAIRAADYDMTHSEAIALLKTIGNEVAEDTLRRLGPLSGYVIFQDERGERFIDATWNVTEGNDPDRGTIVRILRVASELNPL